MRTSKPISTISYNTQSYLVGRLEELCRSKKVCDYMFINHFAEKDEGKNHIHLWIKPNTLLDTMDLQEYLKEYDPEHPDKPLGCIDFVRSAADDFILYAMHLEPYLRSKMQSREYHYTRDDFVYHDEMAFESLYNHALKGSKWAQENQRLSIIRDSSISPAQLIESGIVSLHDASNLRSYKTMKGHLDRNGRPTHTPKKTDPEPAPEREEYSEGFYGVPDGMPGMPFKGEKSKPAGFEDDI